MARVRTLSFFLLALPLFAGDPPAPVAWDPHKTWAFLVDLVTWQRKDLYPSMENPDRRQEPVIEGLLKQRGVPEDRIVVLKDEGATRTKVEAAFAETLGKSQPGDFLFLYFQGHGYFTLKTGIHYFACYDTGSVDETGWSVPSIFDSIEKEFHGSAALLCADCCASGGLAVEAQARAQRASPSRVSYACFTSSSSHNLSAGTWVFSRCLARGLRGDPAIDLDGDGTVELDELGRYTRSKVAFVEEQMSLFATTGAFDPRMALEPSRGKHDPQVGRHVLAQRDGQARKAEVIGEKDGKLRVRWLNDETIGLVEPKDAQDFQPKEYAAGSKVLAFTEDEEDKTKRKWYPARVTKVECGMHLLTYEGKPDSWTEWAPASRIKPRE